MVPTMDGVVTEIEEVVDMFAAVRIGPPAHHDIRKQGTTRLEYILNTLAASSIRTRSKPQGRTFPALAIVILALRGEATTTRCSRQGPKGGVYTNVSLVERLATKHSEHWRRRGGGQQECGRIRLLLQRDRPDAHHGSAS